MEEKRYLAPMLRACVLGLAAYGLFTLADNKRHNYPTPSRQIMPSQREGITYAIKNPYYLYHITLDDKLLVVASENAKADALMDEAVGTLGCIYASAGACETWIDDYKTWQYSRRHEKTIDPSQDAFWQTILYDQFTTQIKQYKTTETGIILTEDRALRLREDAILRHHTARRKP